LRKWLFRFVEVFNEMFDEVSPNFVEIFASRNFTNFSTSATLHPLRSSEILTLCSESFIHLFVYYARDVIEHADVHMKYKIFKLKTQTQSPEKIYTNNTIILHFLYFQYVCVLYFVCVCNHAFWLLRR